MSEEQREDRPAGDGGDGFAVSGRGNAEAHAGATDSADSGATGQTSQLGDALVRAQARIVELEQRATELGRELETERAAATDYMQRWQRAQADFANFKRRAQQEQEHLGRLAGAQALAGILPALDSFERAFATLPPSLRHLSWIDGIGLVHLQLHGALQAAGIKPFAPHRGSAFDAHRQQSIGELETSDVAPGLVAAVVQQGYELGDMVLRPALVQLAHAPQANSSEAGGPSGSGGSQAPPDAAQGQQSGP
jgi:molecular chaperone GrpE